MEESLFMDGVRAFFAMLDRMIYSLITIFYNTISDLAAAQLVKTEVINEITSRIYALLGVFMLFKVSFSLISYIVDPDKITDKNQGSGKLLKNIIITFALIVSTPFAFNMVYEAQSAILADQLIPRFLLGIDINKTPEDEGVSYTLQMVGCSNEIEVNNMGNYIGLALFKPFFVDYEAAGEHPTGITIGPWYGDAQEIYCTAGERYGEPSVKNMLSSSDLYLSPKGRSITHYYSIDYSFFLSTAVGIVVALILLGYCFDIATRSFKLLFLEIIAPIPIISYIDPNSSKSGMFVKWLKEVAGTWISLFTRLASLFLAIFIIQQITAETGELYFVKGYEFNGNIAWIKILIIIGALIFAKQLPKILENILGFQLGGNMTLNPFKKLESEALGFKQATSAAKTGATVAVGAAAGAVGGGVSNAWAAHNNNKNAMNELAKKEKDSSLAGKKWGQLSFADRSRLRSDYYKFGGRSGFGNVASIIGGAGSAAVRSAAAGRNGKFTPFKNAAQGITESSTARTRRAAGFGIKSQAVDKATDMAHIPQSYGTTSVLKNEKKSYEREMNDLTSRREALLDQYRNAMSPEKAPAYQEATKREYEENGKRLDAPRYKYENYADYSEKHSGPDALTEDEFMTVRNLETAIDNNEKDITRVKKEISKIDENMKPIGGK